MMRKRNAWPSIAASLLVFTACAQETPEHEGGDPSETPAVEAPVATADPDDWCTGHGVPESMCPPCNPGLAERLQAEGDWCSEHEFPESVCPICNPMQPPSEGVAQLADPDDWCAGHGVPESMCPLCNAGLAEQLQAEGDWCVEHEFPESVCPTCNPMQPPSELGARTADPDDWCAGHGVPESMCPPCNPGLAERLQAEGDWCAEHGYPESVCPTCNPMQPPAERQDSVEATATDWCSEHGLPESMCTQCNPNLAADYRATGDWCGEHEFPESVCPSCNPVTPPAGFSGPQTRVELTETAFRTSGIRVERATTGRSSSDEIRLPAEVHFDPDRLAHISPLVDGQIVSVSVTVGDRVTDGR